MTLPHFRFERKSWKKGFKVVAGADEVGRGAFAGPVVAAVCIFPFNTQEKWLRENVLINDSKKLTEKQRKRAGIWIKKNAFSWGIGEISVTKINQLGVGKASLMAFRKATKAVQEKMGQPIDFLLIDAFYIPFTRGLRRKNQRAIVKGDTQSFSIAGASILAKVYRDKLMSRLGKEKKYKKYEWVKNKGYGTKSHRKAIEKYGITKMHRKQFVRKIVY